MQSAFAWSLCLAAGVVVASLVPLGAARSKADFQTHDLAAPRAMFDRLPEWGKRANWAHLNSFEAFVLFAPAALLCLIGQVDNTSRHRSGLDLSRFAPGLYRRLRGQPASTAVVVLGRSHGVHRNSVSR